MVWSDQSGGEPRKVPGAAKRLPDPRARHYWDGGRVLGRAYRTLKLEDQTVDLERDGWDLWLLFDRQATWPAEGRPEPAWWEHQLWGGPPERMLDAERFAGKAAELRRPAGSSAESLP